MTAFPQTTSVLKVKVQLVALPLSLLVTNQAAEVDKRENEEWLILFCTEKK